jgi:hypothetical protein
MTALPAVEISVLRAGSDIHQTPMALPAYQTHAIYRAVSIVQLMEAA